MQLLGTTIECWPDVLYVARKDDFHFSELWNKRHDLLKMACDATFFSDDSLMGLTREMKRRIFAYSASVLFNNETNSTSLLALDKDAEQHFTFRIKQIIDGEAKPRVIAEVSLGRYNLNNLNALLLKIQDKMSKEQLIALAGLLILICDGVSSISIDDAWVKANWYEILHCANIQAQSQKDDFVIPVHQSTYSISGMVKPVFPLKPRVIINYTNANVTLQLGNDRRSLKPDECIIGLFHHDQCYCLLNNQDTCGATNISLSIHFDRNKKQTYLSVGKDSPVYRVISFLCDKMGYYLYVLDDGTVECDKHFPFQIWYDGYKSQLQSDEQILAVFMPTANKYRILTNKRILDT